MPYSVKVSTVKLVDDIVTVVVNSHITDKEDQQ